MSEQRFPVQLCSPAFLPLVVPFPCFASVGESPELRLLLPLSMSIATCGNKNRR